jgi:hypothetical protein
MRGIGTLPAERASGAELDTSAFTPGAVAARVVAGDPIPDAIPGAIDDDPRARMTPSGNGTFTHDHSGFSATVARDGSVQFEDKTFDADVGAPCLDCMAEDYKKWKQDPYGGHYVSLMGLLPVLRVQFDVTDWVERLAGNDPYSYEKHEFLERTRERRAAMSRADKRELTREALRRLPDYLARIWAYETWPAAERRYLLFKLWDECDETTDAGAQARATVMAFIRKRVTEPYTDEELERLNAERTSGDPFAP